MDEYDKPATRRRSFTGPLLALVAALLIGAGLVIYAAREWSAARSWLTGVATPATTAPLAVAPQPLVQAAPPRPFAQADAAETDRRVAAIEARLADVDARARLTAGNAERAEAMLVAIAARRAIDAGLPLGYLEGLLRERFGGTQPQAVATIIAAARAPVLLGDLRTELDDAGTALVGRAPQERWWAGLRREVGALIVVRRATTASTRPDERLARAESAVDAGRVELALAEVARLPGREAATDWIGKARRYASARDALDRIETAALLSPRLPAIDPVAAEIAPPPVVPASPAG